MPARRYIVSCRYCLRPIMVVERIEDAELRRLRAHVWRHHPGAVAAQSPGLEATLRHFRVEPEPGPPDAV